MSIAPWFVHSGSVLCRVRSCGALPCLASPRRASARALRARRGGAGRPHGPYRSPTNPRSPHRATPLSHKRSLHPCTPPHGVTRPHADTTQAPRHDDAREVHAGRSWGGRPVRCDCPRSQGHRLGVGFACSQYTVFPPSETYQQHALPAGRRLRALGLVVPSERLWATQRPRSGGVRAPWTVERRAVRSSAPAGSCHRALVGAAARGTCAAWAASGLSHRTT